MHRSTVFLIAASVGLLISASAVMAQTSGTTQGNGTSGSSSNSAGAAADTSSGSSMNDTVDMGSFDEGGPTMTSGSQTHHKTHHKKHGSSGIAKGENGGAEAKPPSGKVQ